MSGVTDAPVGGKGPFGGRPLGLSSRVQGSVYHYPPGSFSFTPEKAGYWKFVLWGAGYSGTAAGDAASGSYSEITRLLDPSKTVALEIGFSSSGTGVGGGDTTATFADGKVVTAGRATAFDTPGAASGGDVNLAGSLAGAAGLGTGGGAASSGAGAPANLPFRGGAGGGGAGTQNLSGKTPGGGGAFTGSANTGGAGMIIVMFVRD